MENSSLLKRPLSLGIALFAALLRILPHLPNFTPIGGLALYSGGRLRGRFGWAVPFVLLFITDMGISFIHGHAFYHSTMPFVYLAFGINVLLGRFLIQSDRAPRIFGTALIASIQFFVVTNLGVWLVGGLYPLTTEGLTLCFAAALPFFGGTLIGDLVFTGVLFGAHRLISERWFPAESAAVR